MPPKKIEFSPFSSKYQKSNSSSSRTSSSKAGSSQRHFSFAPGDSKLQRAKSFPTRVHIIQNNDQEDYILAHGDQVMHTDSSGITRPATVTSVHYNDYPPYYTLMFSDKTTRDTQRQNLKLIKSKTSVTPNTTNSPASKNFSVFSNKNGKQNVVPTTPRTPTRTPLTPSPLSGAGGSSSSGVAGSSSGTGSSLSSVEVPLPGVRWPLSSVGGSSSGARGPSSGVGGSSSGVSGPSSGAWRSSHSSKVAGKQKVSPSTQSSGEYAYNGDPFELMQQIVANENIEVTFCNGEQVPLGTYIESFWHQPTFQQVFQLKRVIDTIKFFRSCGGTVRMQKLLHGTSSRVSNNILKNGFIVGSRALFGTGIYLTNSSFEAAAYARDAANNTSGEPVILECLVLIVDVPNTGNFKHLRMKRSTSDPTTLVDNKPSSVLALVESDTYDFSSIDPTNIMKDDYQNVDGETLCSRIVNAENIKNKFYKDNPPLYPINVPVTDINRQGHSLSGIPGYEIYASKPGTYVFVVCTDLSLLLPVNSTEESLFLNVESYY